LRIIDFRLRPPALGFLSSRIYAAPDNRDSYTRRLGFSPVISAQQQSMDLLFEEMDAAGISTGVVVGRTTATLGNIPNADVAAILDISPLTVKNHMQKILRKLNVQNRAQAVARAIARRLIDSEYTRGS
jgi:hypothetical protein